MSSDVAPPSPVRRRVVSASIWVTTGMLIGRLAGIVREFLIADTFGVSREADVAILLVTGPDVLVTIVGAGAVGLVLIPILLDHDIGTQASLIRRLTARLGAAATLLAFVTAGLAIAFATDWATGPALSADAFRTAVLITAAAVPLSVVGVLSAEFLRAQNRFAVVSFATLTFTVPVLIAIVTFRSVVGVAVGVVAGAALRYGVQLVVIGRALARPSPDASSAGLFRGRDIRDAFAISVLLAAQASAPLLLVAVLGDEGDVALLNYGWRVLLIPISLLGSIFSVAAYPTIVRVLNDAPDVRPSLAPIVRPVILLSLVIGVWLWVNAANASAAVYHPAGLSNDALDDVATLLRVGAIAVPLITIGTATTTILFGLKQSRAGLTPYFVATPLMIILGIVMIPRSGPQGMMWAITTYSVALCCVAAFQLYRSTGLAAKAAQLASLGATVAGAAMLAVAIRYIVNGQTLSAVLLNGALFVMVPIAGYLFARRAWRA